MQYVVRIIVFSLLTIATQIGGGAYLISLPLRSVSANRIPIRFLNSLIWFLVVYTALWFATSYLASQFGRYPIRCFDGGYSSLVMQSPMYCLMNRNYVSAKVLRVSEELATDVDRKFPGTITLALDGNFPFLDGFPLLPHLSHDDGNKLDLAFYYKDDTYGYQAGKTNSPIGYWAFELPDEGEHEACSTADLNFSTRWKMRWFEVFNSSLELERERTAYAIRWLAEKGQELGVTKVFVEPHLLSRLAIKGSNLRFQGCHAARHDDHIHFQTD